MYLKVIKNLCHAAGYNEAVVLIEIGIGHNLNMELVTLKENEMLRRA